MQDLSMEAAQGKQRCFCGSHGIEYDGGPGHSRWFQVQVLGRLCPLVYRLRSFFAKCFLSDHFVGVSISPGYWCFKLPFVLTCLAVSRLGCLAPADVMSEVREADT